MAHAVGSACILKGTECHTVHMQVLVVNQANSLLRSAFSSEDDSMQPINCATFLYYRCAYRLLQPGSVLQMHACTSGVQLPCRVLHMVLLQQQRDENGNPRAQAVHVIVANSRFQIALLACIAELISFASTGKACFPVLTAKLGAFDSIFDIWEALLFVQHYLKLVRYNRSSCFNFEA